MARPKTRIKVRLEGLSGAVVNESDEIAVYGGNVVGHAGPDWRRHCWVVLGVDPLV